MSALVGFVGSRSLAPEWRPLVYSVVRGLCRAGRGVAVGDCRGADEYALEAAQAGASFGELFSVADEAGRGGWAGSLPVELLTPPPRAIAWQVHWSAGGTCACAACCKVPGALGCPSLRGRLLKRTLALVRAVAHSSQIGDGAGLVAFLNGSSSPSSGSLQACRMAASRGLPVTAYRCSSDRLELVPLGDGNWVALPSMGGALAFRWHPIPATALPFDREEEERGEYPCDYEAIPGQEEKT